MSQFSIYPVTIVAADGRIIAILARLSTKRRFHSEMSPAHAVDKLPDTSFDVPANPLPIVFAHLCRATSHAGAIGKRQTIQTTIEARTLSAQSVIPAANQLVIGQKQLFERGEVDWNLHLPAAPEIVELRSF